MYLANKYHQIPDNIQAQALLKQLLKDLMVWELKEISNSLALLILVYYQFQLTV